MTIQRWWCETSVQSLCKCQWNHNHNAVMHACQCTAKDQWTHCDSSATDLSQWLFLNISKHVLAFCLQRRCVVVQHHCGKYESTENAERHYCKVTVEWGEFLKALFSLCLRMAGVIGIFTTLQPFDIWVVTSKWLEPWCRAIAVATAW